MASSTLLWMWLMAGSAAAGPSPPLVVVSESGGLAYPYYEPTDASTAFAHAFHCNQVVRCQSRQVLHVWMCRDRQMCAP